MVCKGIGFSGIKLARYGLIDAGLVRGTPFQLKVWEAFLKIPFGAVTSYQTIANTIRNPNGMRAVGSAVGANCKK